MAVSKPHAVTCLVSGGGGSSRGGGLNSNAVAGGVRAGAL